MEGTRLLNHTLLTMGLVMTNNISPIVVSIPERNTEMKATVVGLNHTTRLLNTNSYSLDKLKLNKQKLNSFKSLSKNWDGYEAEDFDEQTISMVENILSNLTIQPQVFPTSRGTIQIEKYFNDRTFYEIEIGKGEIYAYMVNKEKELEKVMNEDELLTMISDFYI